MCRHEVRDEVPLAQDVLLHEYFVEQSGDDLHDADSRVSQIHMQIPVRQHVPPEGQLSQFYADV
jgi:hypothetical protein